MAKFMLILGGADVDKRSSGNPELASIILERYTAWIRSLGDGRVLGSYKLYDQTGARLTVRGGDVVDGPFVETKEAIGGVFIIEAASLEEATTLARDCPALRWQNGFVEVRAIER
jgi:hypothetical protein